MRRPRRYDRVVSNRILSILCSGTAWRDLPERYGSCKTVYHQLQQWEASGRFDRILQRLPVQLDERDLINYAAHKYLRRMTDSISIRAGRAALGAPGKKGSVGLSNQPLGRSRGGLSTKIHLVCDASGVPLAPRLYAGQHHDTPKLEPLMESVRVPRRRPGRPRTGPAVLVAAEDSMPGDPTLPAPARHPDDDCRRGTWQRAKPSSQTTAAVLLTKSSTQNGM